ncbi:hypothetical protein Tco_1060358 [Tanacetum coccineum]
MFQHQQFVKGLEDDLLEFKQTNQFVEAVSSIPDIVDAYLANKINEAIKTVVQLQSDRLRDEAQAENEDFSNTLDENMRKIIKKQVKEQVKEQVSKILPKIKKLVNDQLEAEVLTRSSNQAKTSHAIAANLSELELKKILIDKMDNNKSIDRSSQQKTLYKALVDAYETNKDILETYGDTVTFKRCQDDEDEDEEPSAGSTGGPREEELEKNLNQLVRQRRRLPSQLASLKKGPNLIKRFTEDQPVDETTLHHDWFQKQTKPPTPDRDWNKTLLAKDVPVQPWISTLALKKYPRTDISIITRKQSKTGKHEHEKQKSIKEARDAKPKPGKVKKSKLWSTSSQPWLTEVNPQKDKASKVTILVPQVFRN